MVICTRCRRIQAPAGACVVCGESLLVDWPSELEQLRERPIVGVRVGYNPEGWGCLGIIPTLVAMFVVGILAGIAGEALIPAAGGVFGLCSFFFTGVGCWYLQFRRFRIRRQERLSAAPPLALPAGRELREGTARRHQQTLPSLLLATPCLGSAVIALRKSDGKEVFSRVAIADFWLDGDGAPLLVCGVMELRGELGKGIAAASPLARAALDVGKMELQELKLHEICLLPGARIGVEGPVGEEVVADLGYRGDRARVMRGVPGAPLVVRVLE